MVGYYANPGKCTGIRIVFCVVLVIVLCLYCFMLFCCYYVILLLCCSVIICVVLYIDLFTVPLPSGVNPIAVDKYIYLYLAMSGKLE